MDNQQVLDNDPTFTIESLDQNLSELAVEMTAIRKRLQNLKNILKKSPFAHRACNAQEGPRRPSADKVLDDAVERVYTRYASDISVFFDAVHRKQ
jgi:hypothetical protein